MIETIYNAFAPLTMYAVGFVLGFISGAVVTALVRIRIG